MDMVDIEAALRLTQCKAALRLALATCETSWRREALLLALATRASQEAPMACAGLAESCNGGHGRVLSAGGCTSALTPGSAELLEKTCFTF